MKMPDVPIVKFMSHTPNLDRIITWCQLTLMLILISWIVVITFNPYPVGFWAGRVTKGFQDGLKYSPPVPNPDSIMETLLEPSLSPIKKRLNVINCN